MKHHPDVEKTMMNERLLFPSEPSVYHLDNVTVIRLEGPDAVKYLNGQVTCDVTALMPGQSTLGAHCNPKGKVLAVFRLFRQEHDLLLLYKKELTEIQLAELKKYAVFSKVTITDVSEQFNVVGIAGTGTDEWIGNSIPQIDTDIAKCQIKQDRWLLLSDKLHSSWFSLPEEPNSDWWGLEILDGLPHLNKNTQAEFIPQALNLHALHAISFTKGCYTGQEIVARAKYRGINNRALFILQGITSQPVSSGNLVERRLGEHWRTSGTILDIWQKQNQLLLSIILPADTAPDTLFRIGNDETSSLSILPLPYVLNEK